MARIRTVKPNLFRHEDLFELEAECGLPVRLAFIGLFTIADRDGRFVWRPRTMKLDVLPYDDVDFSRVLDALASRGFIMKYTVDDEEYGFIPSWQKHQIINNRESTSEIPEPTENSADSNASSTRAARVTDLHVRARGEKEGKGREEEGKGLLPAEAGAKSKSDYSDDFEAFWKAYPTDKNMPKKPAFKQWLRLSPEKRAAAVAALPGFRRYCDENRAWYRVIYAERFLSQEKFEGYTADNVIDMTPERLAELQDRTDRTLRRGKYAEVGA